MPGAFLLSKQGSDALQKHPILIFMLILLRLAVHEQEILRKPLGLLI